MTFIPTGSRRTDHTVRARFWRGCSGAMSRRTFRCWAASIRQTANTTSAISSMTRTAIVSPASKVTRYPCGACPIRKACTDAPFRTVTHHMDEDARQTVRDLKHTWQYDESQRRRKKVEMLFAHLKRHSCLRRLRLQCLKGANEEFLLAATAQNLNNVVTRYLPKEQCI